jgi:hypothetical protein
MRSNADCCRFGGTHRFQHADTANANALIAKALLLAVTTSVHYMTSRGTLRSPGCSADKLAGIPTHAFEQQHAQEFES